jgi:hypothetical protein
MAEPSVLQIAATRKHTDTLARATLALQELASEGAEITFQQVARRAGVSRQWLYSQPELRTEIEKLRQGAPARERSSEASLHQRLRTTLDENRVLRDENRGLKHELAVAYGAQRASAARGDKSDPRR